RSSRRYTSPCGWPSFHAVSRTPRPASCQARRSAKNASWPRMPASEARSAGCAGRISGSVMHFTLGQTVTTSGGPVQEECALALVAGQCGGALELGAGFGAAAELGQQVAADAGEQVVGL